MDECESGEDASLEIEQFVHSFVKRSNTHFQELVHMSFDVLEQLMDVDEYDYDHDVLQMIAIEVQADCRQSSSYARE